MRIQRPILLGLALGALSGACEPADESEIASTSQAARTTVYARTWNGGGADASGYNDLSWWGANAWENRSRGGVTTYASFNRGGVDPTSEVCETLPWDWCDENGCYTEYYTYCYYSRYSYDYGFGEIASNQFRISRTRASLNFAVGSTFWSEHCDVDWANNTYNCTPGGVTGSIHLDWRANDWWRYSNSGSNTWSYGTYSFRNSGTYSNSSADASGTFLGETVSSTWGGIGNGTSATREMFRAL